jgi:hypothetical protein
MTHLCDANASCADQPPPLLSRTCTCNEGHSGDGLNCTGRWLSSLSLGAHSPPDIDACLTQPCGTNATCLDEPAPSLTRTCVCNSGYAGDAYSTCTGIDLAFDDGLHNHLYRLQCLSGRHLWSQCTLHRSCAAILRCRVQLPRWASRQRQLGVHRSARLIIRYC